MGEIEACRICEILNRDRGERPVKLCVVCEESKRSFPNETPTHQPRIALGSTRLGNRS